VAPEVEQSAASHALTTRRPLRIRRFGPRRYAIDGTPTDCVLVALHRVIRGRPPDLVLSGINQGGNLGEDVTYSGTVAAALEAALLGLPAVAFSQLRAANGPMVWATAERYAPEILRALVGIAWPPDLLFNVNFPSTPPDQVTGIRACHQGRRQSGVEIIDGEDPGGRPYVWIGDFSSHHSEYAESDLRAVADGAISVTPLHLDMTHRSTLENLPALLATAGEGRR
jgi:5'-nucleotidase